VAALSVGADCHPVVSTSTSTCTPIAAGPLTSGGTDEDGSILVVDDTVYFAWISRRNGDTDVYMESSDDNGETWSAPWIAVSMTPAPGQTRSDDYVQSLSLDLDGRIRLSGTRSPDVNGSQLYTTASTDPHHFPEPVAITSTTGDKVTITPIRQDASGVYHLIYAWRQGGTGDYRLVQQTSSDAVTWTDPVPLFSPTGYQDVLPAIELDATGTLWLIWVRIYSDKPDELFGTPQGDFSNSYLGDLTDIYISSSTDGVTFSSPLHLSQKGAGSPPEDQTVANRSIDTIPALVQGPSGLYATWVTTAILTASGGASTLMWRVDELCEPSQIRSLTMGGYSVRGATLPSGATMIASVDETASGQTTIYNDQYEIICSDADLGRAAQ